MADSLKEREFLLYRELQHQLALSKAVFNHFCLEGCQSLGWQKCNKILTTVGACGLPGWEEFVQSCIFPLNDMTQECILKIADFRIHQLHIHEPLPQPLKDFVQYHQTWLKRHAENYKDTVCKWTAGRNFPQSTDHFVEERLVVLSESETVFKTMEGTMNSKETNGVGFPAFLTGLAFGLLGVLVTLAKKDSDADFTLDLRDGKDEENVTAETISDLATPTAALLDGIKDVTVDGQGADLLKVRVLGLERAKLLAMWGSKGVNHDQPATFKRFVDLTTEHLVNIKKNSQNVSDDERRLIDSILEDRIAAGTADPTVLE